MQAKPAYSTEQIPHMFDWQFANPFTRSRIQRGGNRWVSLEETLWTDIQRHTIKLFFQRLLLSKWDFLLAFHNRHMYRLNIGRNYF